MNLEFVSGSRTKLLAGLTLAVMAIFVVRLFDLQVIKHDEYVTQANQEQIKRLVIPSKRGEIYVMDHNQPSKLVLNDTVYTVFADPEIATENDRIAEVIRRVAGGSAVSNIDELLAMEDTRYQVLARGITRHQAELMKEENLSGLGFQAETKRVYPEGKLAAQVLGFVNAEGEGQYGVEGYLDSRLQGTDGLLQSITDANNVPLTIGDENIKIPAQDGDNITLTIDRNIQSHVEAALASGLKRTGAKEGSAVVIDPSNGHVLAMANLPTYNPDEYYKVKDAADFSNAVISLPYEPGSVIKTLTLATGLDKNAITASTTYNNKDFVKVDDRVIWNYSLGQTGTITLQHALNFSLNTGMVEVTRLLGGEDKINQKARDIIYDYFHNKYKLGKLTGIELSGEAAGIIIAPTEAEGNAVRYSNMSFGQGMNVTMLQVAGAFSSIINGGTYYEPRVIAGVVKDGSLLRDDSGEGQKVISSSASAQLRKMVVEARKSVFSYADKQGYVIGGKTGTSQVIGENGQYSTKESIGSYVGFGGNGTPKYVIMVRVSGKDQILEGARDAAPIFTDISNWIIDYLTIQPKG